MPKTLDNGDCEAIVRRLWPHLDGVLPDAEREAVVRHLEECGGCRSHFEFARSFLDAVHHARGPDAANGDLGDLRARVVAALAREGFARGDESSR